MKHPRDLYIRACNEVGRYYGFDYFNYNAFTHTKDINTCYKALTRAILNPDVAPQRLKDCYMYFKDSESRIYLEGLLLSYTIDEIIQLKGFTQQFLEDYISYFFDISDIKDKVTENIFINQINEDEVYEWFTKCLKTPFNSMFFIITGNSKHSSAVETIQSLRNDALAVYNSLMPRNRLVNTGSKVDWSKKEIIQMEKAINFAKLAANLACVEVKLQDDIDKSGNSLKEDWRVIIKKKPTSIYDLPLIAPNMPVLSEIQEQLGQFPGLKVPETEQLDELMKNNRDSD